MCLQSLVTDTTRRIFAIGIIEKVTGGKRQGGGTPGRPRVDNKFKRTGTLNVEANKNQSSSLLLAINEIDFKSTLTS